MAPGAAAARKGCPAAACAPLRTATPTLPAAQGRGKERRALLLAGARRVLPARAGPAVPAAAAAALRVRLGWQSCAGFQRGTSQLASPPSSTAAGPGRCSAAAAAAATSCRESFSPPSCAPSPAPRSAPAALSPLRSARLHPAAGDRAAACPAL